jgi:glycosyl transferase, family 25
MVVKMKIYMIVLSTSIDRINFQRRQLDTLGLKAEFFDAITPYELPVSFPDLYWRKWERPIKPTERACFLSHWNLWERIAFDNQPAIIFEDDVIISSLLPSFIEGVDNISGIDHLTLESRGKKKLLARKILMRIGEVCLHRLYWDRAGAAGYILWPSGAQKLLARSQHGASLADAMISQLNNLRSFQSVPALIYQAECSEIFSRENPLPTTSTVSSFLRINPKKAGLVQFLRYKYRRLMTQLGIGFRVFLFFPWARQCRVEPAD